MLVVAFNIKNLHSQFSDFVNRKPNPKLVKALLVVGGLSIAAYLAYSYGLQSSAPALAQKAQPNPVSTAQKMARCLAGKQSKGYESALDVFNCHKIQDQSFRLKDMVPNLIKSPNCAKVRKIFRTMAVSIHPDKCPLTEEKDLFAKAMSTLSNAYEVVCSSEVEIAQCVRSALNPTTKDFAIKVLECGGEEIPQTCSNLKNFALSLAHKVNKVFPYDRVLLNKIIDARDVASCYPIPSFLANWFTE